MVQKGMSPPSTESADASLVTGMLWEGIKVGRVRGCPAPWHKQAPGNQSLTSR
ncbi:hypothetical protein I79_022925 [Cricetulus griseus]|uniref:Uncharacterized protein n=1 Tax=Cricetulus griseus TaxID=10029 RepID=G3IGK7_CRIGR|nr:hypothetical protein I79_022925 [Cricetulus griseus]